MLSAPERIPPITPNRFGAGFAAPDVICDVVIDVLGDDLRQPGLLGRSEQRHQLRVRHQIVLIEARRTCGKLALKNASLKLRWSVPRSTHSPASRRFLHHTRFPTTVHLPIEADTRAELIGQGRRGW